MSLRGSNINSATATNPLSVSFPAGSVAGDLAIAFCSGGAAITLPSGWTSLYSNSSFNWCVIACSKVLSSGDISTGSVSFNIGAGTFDMACGIAVFVGSGTIRETEGSAAGGGNETITNTTSGAVISSDTAIYWASSRRNTTSGSYPVITPGSGSATTLQNATTTNSITIMADQAMPGGMMAVQSVFTGSNLVASVAVQVIVEIGLAPPGGLLINPGMDGGMVPQMKGGING